MRGPVIAISGPPGAGKTTLTRGVSLELGLPVIEYDRFETITQRDPHETQDWLRRGAPYDEIETPGLAAAIKEASIQGPVLFDTPLGRAHPETGGLISISFWINCPADLALARKVAQLASDVPRGEAGAFVQWLDGYLASYEQIVRPACLLQVERVGGLADMTLDATDSIETLIKRICDVTESCQAAKESQFFGREDCSFGKL